MCGQYDASMGKSLEDFKGQVIASRYRVERLLGKGGFGAVFEATNLSMDQPIALKFLHASHLESEEQQKRFEREARNTSKLRHPNCIQIFDFGKTEDGDMFMAMELLDGKPLTDLTRGKKSVDSDRVCNIGIQIAKALSAAHDIGLVHRDLKPDNVFVLDLSGEEFVKVLDFGISKAFTTGQDDQELTKTGVVIGTPIYMSPEQCDGTKKVGPASDLYSLGVMLYKLLAGVPPFKHDSTVRVLMDHISTPPARFQEKVEGLKVSPALEAVILRLLAKDPSDRYASSQDLVKALEEARKNPDVVAAPAPSETKVMDAPLASIPAASASPEDVTVALDTSAAASASPEDATVALDTSAAASASPEDVTVALDTSAAAASEPSEDATVALEPASAIPSDEAESPTSGFSQPSDWEKSPANAAPDATRTSPSGGSGLWIGLGLLVVAGGVVFALTSGGGDAKNEKSASDKSQTSEVTRTKTGKTTAGTSKTQQPTQEPPVAQPPSKGVTSQVQDPQPNPEPDTRVVEPSKTREVKAPPEVQVLPDKKRRASPYEKVDKRTSKTDESPYKKVDKPASKPAVSPYEKVDKPASKPAVSPYKKVRKPTSKSKVSPYEKVDKTAPKAAPKKKGNPYDKF